MRSFFPKRCGARPPNKTVQGNKLLLAKAGSCGSQRPAARRTAHMRHLDPGDFRPVGAYPPPLFSHDKKSPRHALGSEHYWYHSEIGDRPGPTLGSENPCYMGPGACHYRRSTENTERSVEGTLRRRPASGDPERRPMGVNWDHRAGFSRGPRSDLWRFQSQSWSVPSRDAGSGNLDMPAISRIARPPVKTGIEPAGNSLRHSLHKPPGLRVPGPCSSE